MNSKKRRNNNEIKVKFIENKRIDNRKILIKSKENTKK